MPFLSKVTGVPIVDLATRVILGGTLAGMGISSGIWPKSPYVAVKAPVFSFSKLLMVEPSLGPEMKSTGEVMGMDRNYEKALHKALLAAGMHISAHGTLLVTLADRDKAEGLELVRRFSNLGFHVVATEGTARAMKKEGIEVEEVKKIYTGSNEITEKIKSAKFNVF